MKRGIISPPLNSLSKLLNNEFYPRFRQTNMSNYRYSKKVLGFIRPYAHLSSKKIMRKIDFSSLFETIPSVLIRKRRIIRLEDLILPKMITLKPLSGSVN